MKCEKCGGPVKPLFTSFYCAAECDLGTKSRWMCGECKVPVPNEWQTKGHTCVCGKRYSARWSLS